MAVTQEEIYQAQMKVMQAQEELAKLRAQAAPEEVEDYVFKTSGDRSIRLSELFGDKRDLLLVHNMGRQCAYCTLWADEYNGVLDHLQDRAAFAVSTPDPPEQQAEFARGRGWRFPMVSVAGTRFAHDMGFHTDEGSYPGYQPGISSFHKQDDDRIVRVARSPFGPGDTFCSVFHYFALLQDGGEGWGPKFAY